MQSKLRKKKKTFQRYRQHRRYKGETIALSLKWCYLCCNTDTIRSNEILILLIIRPILNIPLRELRAAAISNKCDNPIISISQLNQAALSHDYLIIIQKRREIIVFFSGPGRCFSLACFAPIRLTKVFIWPGNNKNKQKEKKKEKLIGLCLHERMK